MRRILLGLFLIGIVGTLVFNFSSAFFSDKESSAGNLLQAGSLDLLIDNTSYLNGVLNQGTTWTADNLPGHLFFNFNDIKPGDRGEDTISLRVNDNDAWACAQISLTKNDDQSCTTPEQADDPSCQEPNGNLSDGELAQNLNMIFWRDDGDNVLENNEATPGATLLNGSAQQVLNSELTLADSLVNNLGSAVGTPLKGATTYYIGKAWCFGALTLDPLPQDGSGSASLRTPATSNGGISCDGTNLNNSTQTDVVMADLQFNIVQFRNNPQFKCSTD